MSEDIWGKIEGSSELSGTVQTMERIQSQRGESKTPADFGLCSKCINMRFRKTKLMDEEVWCSAYTEAYYPRLKPSRLDNIVNCSQFYPAGQMSPDEMMKIAWIIDVNKRSIGFQGEEKIEVSTRRLLDDKE